MKASIIVGLLLLHLFFYVRLADSALQCRNQANLVDGDSTVQVSSACILDARNKCKVSEMSSNSATLKAKGQPSTEVDIKCFKNAVDACHNSLQDTGATKVSADLPFAEAVVPTSRPNENLPIITVPTGNENVYEATSPKGAMVKYSVTAKDSSGNAEHVTCQPEAGSIFHIGITSVACSSTYQNGISSDKSFNIIVQDTTAPVISGPQSDMITEVTSPKGAIVYYHIKAFDAVDGKTAVECSKASGTTFPLGKTIVNCYSEDKSNNKASFTFNVIVRDTIAPDLSVPSDITTNANSKEGSIVHFDTSAVDIVDGNTIVECTPSSGSMFAVGRTTVSCSSSDKSGNKATKQFIVDVVDVAPKVVVPGDETVEATSSNGAVVIFSSSSSDVVDGSDKTTCNPSSGSTFKIGENSVTCTATDKAGKTGTKSFKITVDDTTPPRVNVPSNIIVEATSRGGAIVKYSASAIDTVDGSTPVSCDVTSGSKFKIGETTVTCSSTDKAGNIGKATFTVTVQDKTPPKLTLPSKLNEKVYDNVISKP